jgi:lactate dehydrogenase-like 2-hydroxyacid dehydrogenase
LKAFIFDPTWDELVTEQQLTELEAAGIELIVTKVIAPLSDCKQLFEGDEDRILCINPDYVAWNLKSVEYQEIPHLKAIIGAATSFSWVDMEHANSAGIAVCNQKGFSAQAVAEWAITMLLNVARQIPCLIKDGFPLDFDKDFFKYRGIELHGKKAGIVGMGNIGKAMASRLKGLGMEVSYWSRTDQNNEYTYTDLKTLILESDVILPVLAVNDRTKELLTDELIKSMKKSAILVSIVHKLFNEQLVLDMVANGQLFGFGFEAKPNTFSNYKGNVWAAPEYAWVTDGSMNASMEMFVGNMLQAAHGKYPNKVN